MRLKHAEHQDLRTQSQNPERVTVSDVTIFHTATIEAADMSVCWSHTCPSCRWTRSSPSGNPSPAGLSHRVAALQRGAVSLSHCFAEQPSCRAGPKLPRPGRPTLRKRSHNKEARVRPPPPNPITQRQRQPPGGLGWVPEPPWCRESRSCGRAACSRENCALCVDEICTVISSAVRVCRPRVGARRTGPASTAD